MLLRNKTAQKKTHRAHTIIYIHTTQTWTHTHKDRLTDIPYRQTDTHTKID